VSCGCKFSWHECACVNVPASPPGHLWGDPSATTSLSGTSTRRSRSAGTCPATSHPQFTLTGAARRCWASSAYYFSFPRLEACHNRRSPPPLPILIDSSSPFRLFSPSPPSIPRSSESHIICKSEQALSVVFDPVSPTWKLASGLGVLLANSDFENTATT